MKMVKVMAMLLKVFATSIYKVAIDNQSLKSN